MSEKKITCITITKEAFWKFLELKAKLKCSTWNDLIEKIYSILIKEIKEKENDNFTGKTSDRK